MKEYNKNIKLDLLYNAPSAAVTYQNVEFLLKD